MRAGAGAGLLALLLLGEPVRASSAEPEEPPAVPPQIEAIIVHKEKEVRAARAEGIKLLEDYLRDSPESPETAEALFKLAELSWEEAQADYLDRMGRYQDLVATCKRDRSRCPELLHRAGGFDHN